MKTYKVVVHYEGAFEYDITAESEDDAKDIAMDMAEKEPNKALDDNLADMFVCDCWQI